MNWAGRRSKRPQLKAVQLGEGIMLDVADFDEDAREAPEADSPFHQIQFQAAPSTAAAAAAAASFSSPSTASSVSSAPPGQRVSFMPIQVPPPTTKAAGSIARAPKHTTTGSLPELDSPFRVLTPTMASSTPSAFHFEVQTSTTHGRRTSSASASGGATKIPKTARTTRTPLPNMTTPWPADDASESSVSMADTSRRGMKRPRLDSDVSEKDFAWQWPMSPSACSGSIHSATSPHQPVFLPGAPAGATLSAVVASDGSPSHFGADEAGAGLLALQAGVDFRRLSVSSLLSGPTFPLSTVGTPTSASTPPTALAACGTEGSEHTTDTVHSEGRNRHEHRTSSGSHYYGLDCGFRDLDIGKNDDAHAISQMPIDACHHEPPSHRGQPPIEAEVAHDREGYYTKPVAVRIPRALGKLPPKLTENPMNLLYFHHFINHTARILVPHDDPQSNPFRTILPQMALKNDNLLSLLLAYSASHRAHVVCQAEPATRIALWVQDIFPALRGALADHKQKISNANVATAIMLASLAIISPTTFGYTIPWQTHLMLAREIIAARPEGLRVDRHSTSEGQVCSFLWSWFAYIDVLGGLSGGPTDASPAWILDYKVYDPQDDDEMDCIMGFTTRCIYILSQIAELVRQCEPERLRHAADEQATEPWMPNEQVEMRAASLVVDVLDSMQRPMVACAHLHRSGDIVRWDRAEMEACNEAYHWAALVHLERRVLGKPTDHPDVRGAVQHICDCVDRVRFGGTAENCLLFPLFTAGCEVPDPLRREKLMQRIASVEGTAMMQVSSAMALMQRAWNTGKPWETLLTNEFIG